MKVSVSICKWIKCSTLQSHMPGLTSHEGGPLHFINWYTGAITLVSDWLLLNFISAFTVSWLTSEAAFSDHMMQNYPTIKYASWSTSQGQPAYDFQRWHIRRGQLPYLPAFCELLHLYCSQASPSLSSCWKLHVEPNIRPGRSIRSGSHWLGSRVRVGQEPTSVTCVL